MQPTKYYHNVSFTRDLSLVSSQVGGRIGNKSACILFLVKGQKKRCTSHCWLLFPKLITVFGGNKDKHYHLLKSNSSRGGLLGIDCEWNSATDEGEDWLISSWWSFCKCGSLRARVHTHMHTHRLMPCQCGSVSYLMSMGNWPIKVPLTSSHPSPHIDMSCISGLLQSC